MADNNANIDDAIAILTTALSADEKLQSHNFSDVHTSQFCLGIELHCD